MEKSQPEDSDFSRTRLCRVLEKHLNPRVDIFPVPTNTSD